jgi:serine O-acetyltransferase
VKGISPPPSTRGLATEPMANWTRFGEDLAATLSRDPAARNKVDVFFNSPGVHALLWHRVANRLWRMGAKLLARIVSTLTRFLTGIEIHPAATLGRRVVIDHGMGVVIGETATVGDDCLIYHGVTLGGKHPGSRNTVAGLRHPTIGSRVTIGAGGIILGPVSVGDDAVIGAHSVVVSDVPPGALAVGVPAVIKKDSQ